MSATKHSVSKRIRIIKRASSQESFMPLGESSTAAITTMRGDEEKLERRDAAATVTRWIGEMRERKDEETRLAFDSLFRTAA